jgi:hypothetical protein
MRDWRCILWGCDQSLRGHSPNAVHPFFTHFFNICYHYQSQIISKNIYAGLALHFIGDAINHHKDIRQMRYIHFSR